MHLKPSRSRFKNAGSRGDAPGRCHVAHRLHHRLLLLTVSLSSGLAPVAAGAPKSVPAGERGGPRSASALRPATGALSIKRNARFIVDGAAITCDEGKAGPYAVPTLLRLELGAGTSALRALAPDVHINAAEAVHQAPGARCSDYKDLLARKDIQGTLEQVLTEETGRNATGVCVRAYRETDVFRIRDVRFEARAAFVVRPFEGCG